MRTVDNDTRLMPPAWPSGSPLQVTRLWAEMLGSGQVQICATIAASYPPRDTVQFRAQQAVDAVLLNAEIVMGLLLAHGASIVPYLLDDDDNPGQRLREAIALLHRWRPSPDRLGDARS